MNDTDGQTIKKLTIRVPIATYLLLDDLARAGRRPLASVARDLLVGRAPKVAPPMVTELSIEVQELLKVCHRCVSNLSQLDTHAKAAGEPLERLSGPAGLLLKLRSKARETGLRAKTGQVNLTAAVELLGRLEGPALALNETLARPLNECRVPVPSMDEWKSVLTQLRDALLGESK